MNAKETERAGVDREPTQTAAGAIEEVIEVPVQGLKPGVYLETLGAHSTESPFQKTSFFLTQQDIDRLKQMSVRTVRIRRGVIPADNKPQNKARKKPPADSQPTPSRPSPPSPPAEKPSYDPRDITRQAQEAIQALLEDSRAGKGVDVSAAKQITDELEEAIKQNACGMLAMGRFRDFERYTYQHSVNVSVLLMRFARSIGLPEKAVRMMGLAGLLHDVGKSQIPDAILCKNGPLTDEEFDEIRQHPAIGARMLEEEGGVNRVCIEIARGHHERMDGLGYPDARNKDSLSQFVRMSTVVDVYDAITAERPYSGGKHPTAGLAVIAREAGPFFDPVIARKFIDTIGHYPPGSLVELTNGEVAVVIDNDHRKSDHPVVRVIYDPSAERLYTDPADRDLSHVSSDDRIKRAADPQAWGIDPLDYIG